MSSPRDPVVMRALLSAHEAQPQLFRDTLTSIPARDRDAWLDAVLGLDVIPDDDPALPPGCVPYLPCSVNTLLHLADVAQVRDDDVFVDVGSGIGRATTCMHLLTGATAVGVEIQPALAQRARELARSLGTPRVSVVEEDATRFVPEGSVYLLYCPFDGARVQQVLTTLASRSQALRIGCIDMPPLDADWLVELPTTSPELTVYRTR